MTTLASNTITLQFPLDEIKPPVTALVMRRPKVRDQLAADSQKGSAAERECWLFASLCEVSLETIEELDMADYKKLAEKYEEMTAGKP